MDQPKLDNPENFKLDPGVKASWVQALLSGRYIQGTGQLHGTGRHCCLGVLESECGTDISRSAAFLQTEVIPFKIQDQLAKLNDGRHTFEQIADLIERDL